MADPRFAKLANMFVNYSTQVKPGETVLIDNQDTPPAMTSAIIDAVHKAGGNVFVDTIDHRVKRSWFMGTSPEEMKLNAEWQLARMKLCQAYICIRGERNPFELGDVPEENMAAFTEYLRKPVHGEQRVKHTKWVVSRWMGPHQAASLGMSEAQYADFYFNATVGVDYPAMSKAMDPLQEQLAAAQEVKVTGPGTDLYFTKKGQGAVKCDGRLNVPDGEVFTAPDRESVQGNITYNTLAVQDGRGFENISLTIEDGKIVDASAGGAGTDALNAILDKDEGARYFGEFAIGLNPYILEAMGDSLFDEKVMGSFHFTPGKAYEDCDFWSGIDNGNRSAVHWDIVNIQTKEKGGGKIFLDDVLIRDNGIFVPEALRGLNPENLRVA